MKIRLTLFFLTFSLLTFSKGLEYHFTNYGVNDGLPSAQVYQIIQGHNGYIWFGTDRGLVSYNGYDFKTYTIKDGLSTNIIFKLTEDDQGRICCYGKDRKIHILTKNRFSPFKFNSALSPLLSAGSNFLDFNFNAEGFAYSSTDMDESAAVFGQIRNNGEQKLIRKLGIHIATGENPLISIKNIDDYPYVDSVFLNDNFVGQVKPRARRNYFATISKTKEHYVFTVGKAVYRLDNTNPNGVEFIHEFPDEILAIDTDTAGNIYIGLRYHGLWKIQAGTGESPECLLPNSSISSVCIDNQNGIWVASLFKGLFYCSNQRNQTLALEKNDIVSRFTDLGSEFFILTQDNDLIRIANTDSGLVQDYAYKPSPLIHGFSNEGDFLKIDWSVELFEMGVFLDKKKKEYVSTFFTGRNSFAFSKGTYSVMRNGIQYFNTQSQKKIVYYQFNTFLNDVMDYGEDGLLLATDDGVVTLGPANMELNEGSFRGPSFSVINMNPYRADRAFFKSKIRDIKKVSDSLIIFGSAERGIYIERKGEGDLWLSEKDGLVSDGVERIYVKDNQLIIVTKEGISVLSEKDGIINYTRTNGLLSNSVNDVMIREGMLWVATDEGTSVFDNIKPSYADIPILLTALSVNMKPEKLKEKYELDYKQNLLDISFEGISFRQAGNMNYKYQLKGVDQSWVTTPNRTVRYANLPYGEFEFWVMAEKDYKIWTNPVCLFIITKYKPFWKTNLFYFLITILCISLIWLAFNIRYRRLARLQEDKFMMLNMERKTLQAQMHPHFVFNSLTSLQSLIISDRKLESQEYLAKFARLTRLALNQSTQNLIALREEIELLTLYVDLERIRYPDKFEYDIQVILDSSECKIPPMLIQPFVENAIKHGLSGKPSNGQLKIVFKKRDENTFCCVVTDNGVGRSKIQRESNEKSLGIKLVKERLSIILKMDKDEVVQIEDLYQNQQIKGTQVTILLPLKQKKV